MDERSQEVLAIDLAIEKTTELIEALGVLDSISKAKNIVEAQKLANDFIQKMHDKVSNKP